MVLKKKKKKKDGPGMQNWQEAYLAFIKIYIHLRDRGDL